MNDRMKNWLINKLTDKIHTQLRRESLLELGSRLSTDMQQNQFDVNYGKNSLDVELLKPPTLTQGVDSIKFPPPYRYKTSLQKDKDPRVVEGIINKSLPEVIKEEVEPVTDFIAVNPFQAEVVRRLQHHPAFNYPRFRTSGLTAAFLVPSLSWHTTDPRNQWSVEMDASMAEESYHESFAYEAVNIEGKYLTQTVSLSTLLWKRINVGLET